MGTKDIVCKQYMRSDEEVIRDLIRLTMPNVEVGELQELNPEETAVVFTSTSGRKDKIAAIMRERDLLEEARVKSLTDGTTDFVIIGFENQDYLDYALPIRVTLENMLNYSWQIQQLRKELKEEARGYPTEFLSGLPPWAKLKPVVTIVVYWSTEPWTGPRKVQDLLKLPTDFNRSLVDNNQLIILEPAKLTDADLLRCVSSLRQVFHFIRDADDKDKIRTLLETDEKFQKMPYHAVHVIEQVTRTGMKLPKNYKKDGTVDMCQAIADMLRDATQQERRRADEASQRADAAMEILKSFVRSVAGSGPWTTERLAQESGQTEETIREWLAESIEL